MCLPHVLTFITSLQTSLKSLIAAGVGRCVMTNIELISKALKNQFIIPEWENFRSIVEHIFNSCKDITEGEVRSP